MSGSLVTMDTRESEKLARKRYNDLKVDIATNFICDNVPDNLPVFRTQCAGYLGGPAKYMNLPFLDICMNLESNSTISYKNLHDLKEILKKLPIEGDAIVKLVDSAEQEIQNILSGGAAVTQPAPGPSQKPSETTAIGKDTGEGFHQKESHVFAYSEMESLTRQNPGKSIGFISVRDSLGTGFRVGDQYVMTAYHVFKDTFETLNKLPATMVESPQSTVKPLSKIFTVDGKEDIKTCVERYLAPTNKELRYQTLLQHIVPSFRERIEKRWIEDTWIAFNKGTDKELKFNFDLNIPFADPVNDILILKLRVDDGNRSKIPEPLHLDEFEIDTRMHLIGYLKSENVAKSLKININCKVYSKATELQKDVKEAKGWWAKNMPDANLDACFYESGKEETAVGRTILHASEEFEHRSSGCPGVIIDEHTRNCLVVQLMYLSGYPSRYYETERVTPPLEYCFESGVSMKRIAAILSDAGQTDLKNSVFTRVM
ncbi:uncharacterized protein LOC117340206 [Pecten maximus]|uniref:uncharacterized protein LOC117340206 n=1 Tax=Pecten maximus TaxID=6579 RepID=UPI001458A49C|nr:uncharacterized protein LOC117340206 [Pecten maximus]